MHVITDESYLIDILIELDRVRVKLIQSNSKVSAGNFNFFILCKLFSLDSIEDGIHGGKLKRSNLFLGLKFELISDNLFGNARVRRRAPSSAR